MKKKLHLKDDLSDTIVQILYKTEYKKRGNAGINKYVNYTKLSLSNEYIEINTSLIDPSKLLIVPFFTKEYIDKLDIKITDNQDPKFNPKINKYVDFYLEKYFVYLCRNKILLDKNRYKLSKHPKLSIIIPVYNRAQYIKKILLSIQNQNVKDIEIIFVDDMSKDVCIKLIEKFIREDDRIVLLKNKKNSGTFYSRFAGLVFSKGEYIAYADSDDFFLPDILGNAYIIGVKKNVEIVQWSFLEEFGNGNVRKGGENHKEGVVLTANELKYYMFYEHHKNYAKIENGFLWDKIYKSDLLVRTMNKFQDDLINDHLSIHDDNLFLFTIFQNANSYYFINQYGYYWYRGETTSIIKNSRANKNANKSFHDIFNNLKFIFTYTPDEEKFKMMCFANYLNLMSCHRRNLKHVTEGFELIKEVINLYLSCRFYKEAQKKILLNDIREINKKQIKLSKININNKIT